jgi:2-(1,2-epoxy-1,2-dihydrophenyl)acetyl-CoA isomerase
LIPDSGCTHLVTRAIGTVKATELFMLGKPFSGADARDWGLITDAVPANKLEETVMKLAKSLLMGRHCLTDT